MSILDLTNVLAGIRRFKNKSHQEIGVIIGVSASRIGRFDTKDAATMTLEEIQKYANALDAEITVSIRSVGGSWEVPLDNLGGKQP